MVEAALSHWQRDELKRPMTEAEQDSIAAEFRKQVGLCIAVREDAKAQRRQKRRTSDGGMLFPPANWTAAVPALSPPSPEPAIHGFVTPSSSPQRLRRSAARFSVSPQSSIASQSPSAAANSNHAAVRDSVPQQHHPSSLLSMGLSGLSEAASTSLRSVHLPTRLPQAAALSLAAQGMAPARKNSERTSSSAVPSSQVHVSSSAQTAGSPSRKRKRKSTIQSVRTATVESESSESGEMESSIGQLREQELEDLKADDAVAADVQMSRSPAAQEAGAAELVRRVDPIGGQLSAAPIHRAQQTSLIDSNPAQHASTTNNPVLQVGLSTAAPVSVTSALLAGSTHPSQPSVGAVQLSASALLAAAASRSLRASSRSNAPYVIHADQSHKLARAIHHELVALRRASHRPAAAASAAAASASAAAAAADGPSDLDLAHSIITLMRVWPQLFSELDVMLKPSSSAKMLVSLSSAQSQADQ